MCRLVVNNICSLNNAHRIYTSSLIQTLLKTILEIANSSSSVSSKFLEKKPRNQTMHSPTCTIQNQKKNRIALNKIQSIRFYIYVSEKSLSRRLNGDGDSYIYSEEHHPTSG